MSAPSRAGHASLDLRGWIKCFYRTRTFNVKAINVASPVQPSTDPLELVRINTASGAMKREVSAALTTCASMYSGPATIDSPTSMYAVCKAHRTARPRVLSPSRHAIHCTGKSADRDVVGMLRKFTLCSSAAWASMHGVAKLLAGNSDANVTL